MVDYKGEVRTRKDTRETIFGMNIGPVTDLQLNDESI